MLHVGSCSDGKRGYILNKRMVVLDDVFVCWCAEVVSKNSLMLAGYFCRSNLQYL